MELKISGERGEPRGALGSRPKTQSPYVEMDLKGARGAFPRVVKSEKKGLKERFLKSVKMAPLRENRGEMVVIKKNTLSFLLYSRHLVSHKCELVRGAFRLPLAPLAPPTFEVVPNV